MHTQNDLFSLQKPETTGLYTHNQMMDFYVNVRLAISLMPSTTITVVTMSLACSMTSNRWSHVSH